MKILITGANGFIGKNLIAFLSENKNLEVVKFTRENNISELVHILPNIDFIFHLAGINRPLNENEFYEGNTHLTKNLCDTLIFLKMSTPILFSSTIQVEQDNSYGKSKLNAEKVLFEYSEKTNAKIYLFRLPNVFGKWSKPNYNSVVSTFCYNISHNLPIQINNSHSILNLVYIDDVIIKFYKILINQVSEGPFVSLDPIYQTTVGFIASQIKEFNISRQDITLEKVGVGLLRALYVTYLSFLPHDQFIYNIKKNSDARGDFVEFLKTKTSGQFSFFTAFPGVTRGGHYHHTKTEKFLVIKGKARYRFRHILTSEFLEIVSTAETPEIIETIPGWAHDITNIGDSEMVVMLWANEIFDKELPDTIACEVKIK